MKRRTGGLSGKGQGREPVSLKAISKFTVPQSDQTCAKLILLKPCPSVSDLPYLIPDPIDLVAAVSASRRTSTQDGASGNQTTGPGSQSTFHPSTKLKLQRVAGYLCTPASREQGREGSTSRWSFRLNAYHPDLEIICITGRNGNGRSEFQGAAAAHVACAL